MNSKYSLRVFWSEPDCAWIATCPEFPGLSVTGTTRVGAIAEAELCLKAFIEISVEDGCKLPTPEVWTENRPTKIKISAGVQ